MKRLITYALAGMLLALSACGTAPERVPGKPIQVRGETAPMPGCEDLRRRGGAC